jgi:nucleotide-binding universal stress UspA family protein
MIQYKNIMFCTDYSEDAEIAFVYAADMAPRYGARLHIFHVPPSLHRYMPTETGETAPPGEVIQITKEVKEKITGDLRQRYESRLPPDIETVFETAVGTPFVEILRYAREKGVDLIILGAKGASEFEPTHYGSTVDQVSRRAHCPVMAIRNPEKIYTLKA